MLTTQFTFRVTGNESCNSGCTTLAAPARRQPVFRNHSRKNETKNKPGSHKLHLFSVASLLGPKTTPISVARSPSPSSFVRPSCLHTFSQNNYASPQKPLFLPRSPSARTLFQVESCLHFFMGLKKLPRVRLSGNCF